MTRPTDPILGIFGVTFGLFVLVIGAHALLSQKKFLHLYNRWQKKKQFGLKPFDLGYFGGSTKLKLLGIGLVAIGLLDCSS
jgi:hypothetical protein